MGLSFKEASAWVTTIVVANATGFYLVDAWSAPFGLALLLLFKISIGIIAWMILLHIVLAVRKPPEPILELDRAVGARASRFGYAVLTGGIFVVIGQSLFPEWLGRLPFLADLPPRTLLLNFAVLALAAATITDSIAQIVLYRRSAWHGVVSDS